MKQLLTLCLLSLLSFGGYAQSKPSKKQTLDYLDKTLKMSVGYVTYKNEKGTKYRIEGASFYPAEVKYEFNFYASSTDQNYLKYEQYSNIHWEDLEEVKIERNSKTMDKELTRIYIRFATKIRYDAQGGGDAIEMDDDMHYPTSFTLYILKTKAESVKKALERLRESAKEENKDPS